MLPIDDPSVLQGKRIPVFMAEDVVPFVNSRYRIAKGAENMGVGGFSTGSVADWNASCHPSRFETTAD